VLQAPTPPRAPQHAANNGRVASSVNAIVDTAPGILSASLQGTDFDPSSIAASLNAFRAEVLDWVGAILAPCFGYSPQLLGGSGYLFIAEEVTYWIEDSGGGCGALLATLSSPVQLYEMVANALRDLGVRSLCETRVDKRAA
jgi:hypothetical protein